MMKGIARMGTDPRRLSRVCLKPTISRRASGGAPFPRFPTKNTGKQIKIGNALFRRLAHTESKRASQPAHVQRQVKRDALIKRARKAAMNGRVRTFVFFLYFLRIFTWVTLVAQWVVGKMDYFKILHTSGKVGPHRGPGRLCRGIGIMILVPLLGNARSVDSHAFASSGARPLTLNLATGVKTTWAFSLGDAVARRGSYGPRALVAGRRADWAFSVGRAMASRANSRAPWAFSVGPGRPVGLGRTGPSVITMKKGGPIACGERRAVHKESRRCGCWGRVPASWMVATVVNQRRKSHRLKLNKGREDKPSGYIVHISGTRDANLPTLRAGGGVSKCNVGKRDLFAKNQAELAPVALMDWRRWYGAEAAKLANQAVEKRIWG